jgi:signal transduction histidine kinase
VPPGRPFSAAVKICIYRFIQEGLTNAWRHAGGAGQKVELSLQGSILTLTVSDKGPGFGGAANTTRSSGEEDGGGMGLTGVQDRVESLGGAFERLEPAGGGAAIRMTLDVKDG